MQAALSPARQSRSTAARSCSDRLGTARMKLTGRAALVSGAGGGIGRAICLAFAEAGAAVACCDIDAASAEETAERARNAGGRPIAQPCDVSVEAQTEGAAAAARG